MYTVYFAGDLFDQKHITGNLFLAQGMETLSRGRFKFILPQNSEGVLSSASEIRNRDITYIIQSDLVLFNFDGVDLDSGTVVEFMIAKMLDIPVVLLRTDCRNGGYLFGDDWNLMASGYPRSVVVNYPALTMYQQLGIEEMHKTIVQAIIDAFAEVVSINSLLTSFEDISNAYHHVIKMCGADLSHQIKQQWLHDIITAKIDKNIYSLQAPINMTRKSVHAVV